MTARKFEDSHPNFPHPQPHGPSIFQVCNLPTFALQKPTPQKKITKKARYTKRTGDRKQLCQRMIGTPRTSRRSCKSTNGQVERRIRACGGAGWPLPGCGVVGLSDAGNAVPAKKNKLWKIARRGFPPFGDRAGCPKHQNGYLEDWVSGPSSPERTFQLAGRCGDGSPECGGRCLP